MVRPPARCCNVVGASCFGEHNSRSTRAIRECMRDLGVSIERMGGVREIRLPKAPNRCCQELRMRTRLGQNLSQDWYAIYKDSLSCTNPPRRFWIRVVSSVEPDAGEHYRLSASPVYTDKRQNAKDEKIQVT